MKPYGVRHALFNNAIIRPFVNRSIIASPVQRTKQHAVDYNFSENLYFGETTSNWLTGRDYDSLNEVGDFDANLPIANYSYVDGSVNALPLVVDETTEVLKLLWKLSFWGQLFKLFIAFNLS